MTLTPPAILRRGQTVLLDTALHYAGTPLRGRRGTIHRLSGRCVFVCTCASSSGFHAANCPVDMALVPRDIIRATAGSTS